MDWVRYLKLWWAPGAPRSQNCARVLSLAVGVLLIVLSLVLGTRHFRPDHPIYNNDCGPHLRPHSWCHDHSLVGKILAPTFGAGTGLVCLAPLAGHGKLLRTRAVAISVLVALAVMVAVLIAVAVAHHLDVPNGD